MEAKLHECAFGSAAPWLLFGRQLAASAQGACWVSLAGKQALGRLTNGHPVAACGGTHAHVRLQQAWRKGGGWVHAANAEAAIGWQRAEAPAAASQATWLLVQQRGPLLRRERQPARPPVQQTMRHSASHPPSTPHAPTCAVATAEARAQPKPWPARQPGLAARARACAKAEALSCSF